MDVNSDSPHDQGQREATEWILLTHDQQHKDKQINSCQRKWERAREKQNKIN